MFLSGKAGAVKVTLAGESEAYWNLSVWDALDTTDALNVTDTESERSDDEEHVFVENIPDLTQCIILAKGRRDAAANAIEIGKVYEFRLEESADLAHVVNARVTRRRRVADANVSGGIAIEITAESTGAFEGTEIT